MKATETKLLTFLKKSPQFVIPIYQRTYSWTENECQQLWTDIIRTGKHDKIFAHFIGSIVYIEKSLYQVTTQHPLLVIDGQQRITTIFLLLEALSRKLGDEEILDVFSAKKLRNYYLLNPEEKGEKGYKLLLTQTDKESLISLVTQKKYPKECSIRISENFDFFVKQINALDDNELEIFCKGISKLLIVDISLSRDQDNPQLIFESMNSTGRELSQADLIRNFILMDLDPDTQTALYEKHWRPMEKEFGQQAYNTDFNKFMRHYLTFKTGDIPNVNRVYDVFKKYSRRPDTAKSGVESLVSDIHLFATYYCNMALGKEPDNLLSESFKDLRELKVEVAYPFLLELYDDYKKNIISRDEFLKCVRAIEAYVFRRAVCAIPTNSLNKTFPAIGKTLNKERYLESLFAYLLLLPSYRRFPNNEEFKRELKTRDLYHSKNCSYCLRRIENFDRKERVPVNEYTTEHILPQNDNLSTEWQESLGSEWESVQETYLHTLGNLTLTGYNSEYSDKPFKEKRDMKGGFRDSPLQLNKNLGGIEDWNESTINIRADELASIAVNVWGFKSLSSEILDTYRQTPKQSAPYTIDHYTHLTTPKIKPLFETLQRELKAIDPCVSEELRKLYIAYKAETNFVDIEPQANRLRLSLNMKFHEINDPKGMCRDITYIGRWGNGDVEVGLSELSEIPYIMSLINQAFKKQFENNESDT